MRGYWTKIILGMFAIALVGTTIVRLARKGVETRHRVVETAEPITIPLAFIPFNVDGQRVGSVKRLRILRSAPKSITGFQIRVEVSDVATYQSLSSGCVLSVDDPTRFSNTTSFSCQPVDSALVEFGRVEVLLAEGSNSRLDVPLYLAPEMVAEFRNRGADSGQVASALANADSVARQVRRMADSIASEARALADSARRQAASRPPRP